MCYALYIGVDEPLPTSDVVEAEDRFHLETLADKDLPALDKFSRPHVYYASSWQGCGCGWYPDTIPHLSRKARDADRDRTRSCLHELSRLLDGVLDSSDAIELLFTWEGRQHEAVERRLDLTPADFGGDSLPMQEQDFAVVSKGS